MGNARIARIRPLELVELHEVVLFKREIPIVHSTMFKVVETDPDRSLRGLVPLCCDNTESVEHRVREDQFVERERHRRDPGALAPPAVVSRAVEICYDVLF